VPLSFFHRITNQCQPPTELMMAEFLISLPVDDVIHWRDKLLSLNEETRQDVCKYVELSMDGA
jgi:hypothetical protein